MGDMRAQLRLRLRPGTTDVFGAQHGPLGALGFGSLLLKGRVSLEARTSNRGGSRVSVDNPQVCSCCFTGSWNLG